MAEGEEGEQEVRGGRGGQEEGVSRSIGGGGGKQEDCAGEGARQGGLRQRKGSAEGLALVQSEQQRKGRQCWWGDEGGREEKE